MTEKWALITGAGSGIGKAVALALLRQDWSVVAVGRRLANLEETQSLAGDGAGRVFVAPADVSDPDAVSALFEAVRARAGRLDLLFNNAGTNTAPVAFDQLRYEDWQRVVSVNLTGAFLVAQAAFRLMKTQRPMGGRIINNGSISAYVPRPNSAPYTATKHAITGLTRSLSLDGRAFDIACGQIDIGNASTAIAAQTAKGVLQANGTVAAEAMLDTGHVANAVVYMASLPLEANVQFMTVMATKMPYIGRG
jgi:NAD(P)-dependent dehydrogenase (short-subunit alcohol dehydrogenase family)